MVLKRVQRIKELKAKHDLFLLVLSHLLQTNTFLKHAVVCLVESQNCLDQQECQMENQAVGSSNAQTVVSILLM